MSRHSSVKWITCKSCNHEYSNELQRCPSCGKSAPLSLSKALGAVSIAAVAVIAVSGIILGFTEKKAYRYSIKAGSKLRRRIGAPHRLVTERFKARIHEY